jgi:ankyrin repeat protein
MYFLFSPHHTSIRPSLTYTRIDPSLRLRRAIHNADVLLVKRILRSHPPLLHNPDFSPTGLSNTNLHLTCTLGHFDIATLLLAAGHEHDSVSLNEDRQTPLMFAARDGHTDIVLLLCQSNVAHIAKQDIRGRDAAMYACIGGHDTVLQILLTYAPAPPSSALLALNGKHNPNSSGSAIPPSFAADARFGVLDHVGTPASRALLAHADIDGNTALHFASSNGHLLILRTLLAAGADPERRNLWSWSPVAYSATVQAEVYFKGLIGDTEKRKGIRRDVEVRGVGGAVRLVSGNDGADDH